MIFRESTSCHGPGAHLVQLTPVFKLLQLFMIIFYHCLEKFVTVTCPSKQILNSLMRIDHRITSSILGVEMLNRTPRNLETVAYEIGFLVAKPSPQTKCEKGLKGPNALSYSPTGALHPFEADASKYYYSVGNMFPMLKPKRSPVKELRKFPFMHALYGGIITTFRWVFQGENGKFRTLMCSARIGMHTEPKSKTNCYLTIYLPRNEQHLQINMIHSRL